MATLCRPRKTGRRPRYDEHLYVPLVVWPLEERCVLDGAPPGIADVLISAGIWAGDSTPDTFQVSRNGPLARVVVNGTTVHDFALTDTDRLVIQGSNDRDTVLVDFSAGNPLSAAGMLVEGGAGGEVDSLVVGGAPVANPITTLAHRFSGVGTGSIDVLFSTGPAAGISYAGIEEITDPAFAGQLVFDLAGGGQSLTISDDLVAGDGVSSATVSDGTAISFDSTSLALTIASADALANTVQIGGFDSQTGGAVLVTGDSLDEVVVSRFELLPQSTLSIEAGQIDLTGPVSSSGGIIDLDAGPGGAVGVSGTVDVAQVTPVPGQGTITLNGGTILVSGGMKADALTATAVTTITSSGAVDVSGAASWAAGVVELDSGAATSQYGSLAVMAVSDATLRGISVAGLADIASGGSVLLGDFQAAALSATGNGLIADDGDVVISGLATFDAGSGDIRLGSSSETTHFGSLNFRGAAVTIREDSSTRIVGTNSAQTLALNSTGGIMLASGTRLTVNADGRLAAATSLRNESGAVLDIGGGADLTAATIDLGNQAGDRVDFGTLTVHSPGNVSIAEDSATRLVGTSTAGNLTLVSEAGMTLAAGSRLTVSGNAALSAVAALTNESAATLDIAGRGDFTAAMIDLGNQAGDRVDFGTLTVHSSGSVSITEDSATRLVGTSTAGNLTLVSAAGMTLVAGSRLTVSGDAALSAAATLTNESAATLDIAGRADLTAATIDLGNQPGDRVDFGTLTVHSSGSVSIAEDSATRLVGTSTAGNLTLVSAAGMTLAAGSRLTVSGDAVLSAVAALTNESAATLDIGGRADLTAATIDLGRQAGDMMHLVGPLTVHATGLAAITADGALLLAGASTAGAAVLESAQQIAIDAGAALTVAGDASVTALDSLTANADSAFMVGGTVTLSAAAIDLGNQAGDQVDFGAITFRSSGLASIAEDSATRLVGASMAGTLVMSSAGEWLLDTGAELTVSSAGAITATGSIANQAQSTLAVDGHLSLVAAAIDLGNYGDDRVELGTLTFQSSGFAAVATDSSLRLVGASSAPNASLESAADLVMGSGAELAVSDALLLSAQGRLSNEAGVVLTVGNDASLVAAVIDLGTRPGDMVNFGSVALGGGDVHLEEDSATLLVAADVSSIRLRSADAIVTGPGAILSEGLLDFAAAGDIVVPDSPVLGALAEVQAGRIVLNAGGLITLADGAILQSATGRVTNAPPVVIGGPLDPDDVIIPGDPTQDVLALIGAVPAPGQNQERGANFIVTATWDDGIHTQISGINAGSVLDYQIGPSGEFDSPPHPGEGVGQARFTVSRFYSIIYLATRTTDKVRVDVEVANDPNIVLDDSRPEDLNRVQFSFETKLASREFPRPVVIPRSDPPLLRRPETHIRLSFGSEKRISEGGEWTSEPLPQQAEVQEQVTRLFIAETMGEAAADWLQTAADSWIELPADYLQDLDALFELIRQRNLPDGRYRLVIVDPPYPPRVVLEFEKAGEWIGEPVREPGRGSHPLEAGPSTGEPDQSAPTTGDPPEEAAPSDGSDADASGDRPSATVGDGTPAARAAVPGAAWSFSKTARLARRIRGTA